VVEADVVAARVREIMACRAAAADHPCRFRAG
jgi:hypothetical protein